MQVWGLNHPKDNTKQFKTENQPEESGAGQEKAVKIQAANEITEENQVYKVYMGLKKTEAKLKTMLKETPEGRPGV